MKRKLLFSRLTSIVLSVSLVLGNAVPALAETEAVIPEETVSFSEDDLLQTVLFGEEDIAEEEKAVTPEEPEAAAEADEKTDILPVEVETTAPAAKTEEEPELLVKEVEGSELTYEISYINYKLGANQRLRVAVWSDNDGQDDLVWYKLEESNGVYKITVKPASYKSTGLFNVHLYLRDENNKMNYLAKNTFTVPEEAQEPDEEEEPETEELSFTAEASSSGYTIKAENVETKGMKEVRVAVWSDKNGQDDLVWLKTTQMTGGKISIAWNPEEYGLYHLHLYVRTLEGKMIFQKGIKVTVEGPSAESIKITTSNSKGSFKITVSGVTSPKALKSIVIPVWSDANQKDIVWYTATKQSDGTYTVSSDISKHGYRMGTYHAHVYAKETSGKMTYMLNDNFTIQGSVDSFTAELSEDGTTAKIKASGISLPMEVSKIEFAVWSKENGQDDIKWYSAALKDGEASVSVPISNHKTAGDYNVHMYAKTASGRVYVTNTTFNIAVSAKADVEFSDREESKGTFKVTATLSDVEGTVSGVKAKVWCKGESTDLNTYTAKENSDGSYSFTVDIANHKVNTGTYKVEIYPVFAGEVEVLAGSGQYSFSVSDYITIVNKGSGKRQAVLKNPSAKYSKVKFPTWSDTNGQDDIVWYNATKQSDGSWTADIVTGKHSGKYIVHCYCDDVYKGNTSFTFAESEMKSIGAQKVDEYASRIIAATGGNLRSIYLWIVNNINYEHMDIPMAYPAGYTRQQYYMVYGFEHRTGNCFVYAALFYWTALKLGYNAKLIEGRYRRNDGTHGEHGWVEIWQNGVAYVCDPEIAWQGMQYDTYMRPYGSTVLTYFPNERAY